jgi:hypothetical protein
VTGKGSSAGCRTAQYSIILLQCRSDSYSAHPFSVGSFLIGGSPGNRVRWQVELPGDKDIGSVR